MSDGLQIEKKLEEIFRIILHVGEEYDVKSVRRINERRWDSLAHISLIAAIESEFGVQLEIVEMERMASFSSAYLLVKEKVA